MRTVQIIAVLGALLVLIQFVVVIWMFLSIRDPFIESIPALLQIGFMLLIFWRLWHRRRWAAIGTLLIAVNAAAYCLFLLPTSLPFLVAFLYTLWRLPREWHRLTPGF